jgi:hypothetical protein
VDGREADPAEFELFDLLSDINCPTWLAVGPCEADFLRSLKASAGGEGSTASIGDT